MATPVPPAVHAGTTKPPKRSVKHLCPSLQVWRGASPGSPASSPGSRREDTVTSHSLATISTQVLGTRDLRFFWRPLFISVRRLLSSHGINGGAPNPDQRTPFRSLCLGIPTVHMYSRTWSPVRVGTTWISTHKPTWIRMHKPHVTSCHQTHQTHHGHGQLATCMVGVQVQTTCQKPPMWHKPDYEGAHHLALETLVRQPSRAFKLCSAPSPPLPLRVHLATSQHHLHPKVQQQLRPARHATEKHYQIVGQQRNEATYQKRARRANPAAPERFQKRSGLAEHGQKLHPENRQWPRTP